MPCNSVVFRSAKFTKYGRGKKSKEYFLGSFVSSNVSSGFGCMDDMLYGKQQGENKTAGNKIALGKQSVVSYCLVSVYLSDYLVKYFSLMVATGIFCPVHNSNAAAP